MDEIISIIAPSASIKPEQNSTTNI